MSSDEKVTKLEQMVLTQTDLIARVCANEQERLDATKQVLAMVQSDREMIEVLISHMRPCAAAVLQADALQAEIQQLKRQVSCLTKELEAQGTYIDRMQQGARDIRARRRKSLPVSKSAEYK